MPDNTTCTVNARELGRALANAALFASTDPTLPRLTCIHLECRNGWLVAEGTDRYTAVQHRVRFEGDPLPRPLLVSAKDAVAAVKNLVKLIGDIDRYTDARPVISIRQPDGVQAAEFTLTGHLGPDTTLWAPVSEGDFPKLDSHFGRHGEAEGESEMRLDAPRLARLAKLDDGQPVTRDLVQRIIGEELATIRAAAGDGYDAARYDQAAGLFSQVALADDYAEFLTLPAYEEMP
jgi:hypothetical protein